MKPIHVLLLAALAGQGCRPAGEKKAAPPAENRIQAENRRQGTTDWLIRVPRRDCPPPDHAFCRRPRMEGYCSRTSYRAGDTLTVFTSTNPAAEYTLDIYRMGYYGGKGGRLVQSVGPLPGTPQPVPAADPTNLVECRWAPAFRQVVPPDWTSGVYLGKLTVPRDSSQAYIVFIVRDDRPADVLFQCSDLTWQAYNRWPGWHSMYDEGQKPWVNTNGARISFDRPYSLYVNGLPMDFNPLTNGSGEFLLWEFPLAFWLEKEGYDVSYISNLDTHADPDGLLRGKALLSVGHDEYWTPRMMANVRRALDRGVNLLFLGGNSLDGTVYLDAASDGRPDRITGRLPQRQFADEQELMGATSYGVGYADFVCRRTDHWLYEGTGLRDGDVIPGLVGWEYHGYPLKRDTSALVVLGRSAIKPNRFGAAGAPDHAATLYTTPKGNFVFNAGTCFWSLPLSRPPGSQNPVCNQGEAGTYTVNFRDGDPRIRRMMHNLLGRAKHPGH